MTSDFDQLHVTKIRFEDTNLIVDKLQGLGAHSPGDGEALLPVHDPLHRHSLCLAAGLETRHTGLCSLSHLERVTLSSSRLRSQ